MNTNIKLNGSVSAESNILGALTVAYSSRCSVGISGDQTITNNTWTVVELDDEHFDGDSEFNITTHIFTTKAAGYYVVAVNLAFNDVDSTEPHSCTIQVNEATVLFNRSHGKTGIMSFVHVGGVIYLAEGDEMRVRTRHQAGHDVTLDADQAGGTIFSLHRLS